MKACLLVVLQLFVVLSEARLSPASLSGLSARFGPKKTFGKAEFESRSWFGRKADAVAERPRFKGLKVLSEDRDWGFHCVPKRTPANHSRNNS